MDEVRACEYGFSLGGSPQYPDVLRARRRDERDFFRFFEIESTSRDTNVRNGRVALTRPERAG